MKELFNSIYIYNKDQSYKKEIHGTVRIFHRRAWPGHKRQEEFPKKVMDELQGK